MKNGGQVVRVCVQVRGEKESDGLAHACELCWEMAKWGQWLLIIQIYIYLDIYCFTVKTCPSNNIILK
ncbi:hypothetical protein Hanom_Chr02g00172541 [Helianthus anomalus]